ncbi:MAG: DUF4276 family protein [Betaproteobacteria bacterium]|nr:DUF4276 family protein [Betaproteobacteria bacterium]
MVSARLYIEGGESKEDQTRCREAFRKLFEKAGLSGRMPRLVACGGRDSAFHDFKVAHASRCEGDYIAMLVDSEDPLGDLETTWAHLKVRDHWAEPAGVSNEQVLFMTTCMETWIVADPDTLRAHYSHEFQESALPSLTDLENRNRHEVCDQLEHASRNCSNAFSKGKRSFEVLAKLNPDVLKLRLPSFARVIRILKDKL